ncbi:MAG: arginine deiminase [Victivallales bacterium]|nr:arginine deiminase [Victivallales bacterium]
MDLNVYSEIGNLNEILLHRPGKEIENLTPNLLDRLLFDDIPYLKIAQEEHDAFAETLRKEGVKVRYLTELAGKAIETSKIREMFINEFLQESRIDCENCREAVKDYLLSFHSSEDIIKAAMAGIRKKDLRFKGNSLNDIVYADYPFVCDPMPNLYFTRDPFVTIGSGISLNHMKSATRRRETIFAKYIFRYHPEWRDKDVAYWYRRENLPTIEGGDILILNDETIAIGISQRTEAQSIEKICKRLFFNQVSPDKQLKRVLAFHIPSTRAFMHLDTVFTQVDHDKFTVHAEIEGPLSVYTITPGTNGLNVNKEVENLKTILQEHLNKKITLIKCGGGDKIDGGREQWNDGSNTLAIRPGEVIVYSRNYITNKILEDNGVKVHRIPSSELSRGRGGPRCMSMPLNRGEI